MTGIFLKNEQVTGYQGTRGALVTYNAAGFPSSASSGVSEDNHIHTAESPSTIHRALSDAEKKSAGRENFAAPYLVRTRAEIEPFDFETDPDSNYNYNAIALYVECAARCGGALIRHAAGVVKRYPCSCENAAEAMTA